MATQDSLDYAQLQQDAMRGVVKAVLRQVEVSQELPGDHHFYISFSTLSPGVILSKRLREKYPQDMTIVLQHRFWDLIVTDTQFEVKLTFDGIPERVVVPYAAIKMFVDPSVNFGMQFETYPGDSDNDSADRDLAPAHSLTLDAAYDGIGEAHLDSPRATLSRSSRPIRKPRAVPPPTPLPAASGSGAAEQREGSESGQAEDQGDREPGGPAHETSQSKVAKSSDLEGAQSVDADADTDETSDNDAAAAKVVSLDQFRKK